MKRLVVVDDETKLLRLIASLFEDHGWRVRTATRAEEAEQLLRAGSYDVLVTDVRLPRRSGIELLKLAHSIQPDLQVVVISAYGTVSGAVEAMRLGAFDYLLKPFELEGLLLIAERALEARRLLQENLYLREEKSSARPGHRLVADSPSMRAAVTLMDRVADTDTTVLLLGESGVGKELVAQRLHERSARSGGPFVRVNCPAIPRDLVESELFGHVRGAFTGAESARKGKFEIANGGTLFLDEIGDLPPDQQSKLLHVLESQQFSRVGSSREIEVDVRILAATNQDLEDKVRAGTFREDLFYRLNVFPVRIPPLRERSEDLPGLVDEMLARLGHRLGRPGLRLADGQLPVLQSYSWPGNVRELRNVLERAAVLSPGPEIGLVHLPAEIRSPCPPGEAPCESLSDSVDRYKEQVLLSALRACNWQKSKAAARLGISARAMSHYVQRFDLDRHR